MPATLAAIPTPPSGRSPRQHFGYLDGLRALAAIFVMLHHSMLQVNFQGVAMPRWVSGCIHILGFGHYAVDVFIVLSGFCLALPVVKGDGHLAGGALTFFQKRARRILPPYFFAMAFSLVLIWLAIGHKTRTHWDCSIPVTWQGLVAHLFLVQDVFRGANVQINHAFWSISVEWHIYFLFPVLMAMRRRWNSVTMAGTAVAVSYALLYFGQHMHSISSRVNLDTCGVTPQYLGLFAIGLLGADIAFGKNPPLAFLRKFSSALVLLVFSTLVMIAASKIRLWHGNVMPLAYTDFFVGIWAATVMMTAANTENAATSWLNTLFSWRPLVVIGTFAYSVYLIHAPLIQVIWQYLLFPLQPHPLLMFLGLCLIGTPLIIGVAYYFHLAFERPFMSKPGSHTPKTEKQAEIAAVVNPAP